MCSRVVCYKCNKFTWSGCGAHVEQALAGVPKNERCSCRAEQSQSPRSFQSVFRKR